MEPIVQIQETAGRFRTPKDKTILAVLLCVCIETLILFAFQGLGLSSNWTNDERSYNQAALNILDHHRFSTADAPPYDPAINITPGYPLFLAFIYSITTRSIVPVLLVQFLMLAAASWLTYILARRFVTRQAATIGAVLCVTYPPLVFMATYRLTEVAATFLMVLFILGLLACLRGGRRQLFYALLTGIIAGIAALVRPSSGLLVLVPLAACILQRNGIGLRRRAALFLMVSVGFAAFVAPWTIRNYTISGRFIPFSTIAGWSIFISIQQYSSERNHLLTGQDWEQIIAEHRARRARARSEVEHNGLSPVVQHEVILNQSYMADLPRKIQEVSLKQVLIGVPLRMFSFWSVGDSLIRRFHRVAYLNYFALVLLVIAGIYLCRKELIAHWPIWIVPVYLTLVHLVFHAETRYSFPARPFLIIYAGVALDRALSLIRSQKLVSFRTAA
ncbi:MAG TPA: glycosyltransferase family 39 protein [Blastocatellia bacterium]|nr:glycosyltransferase family 39 protein [Blastocatellia bacterium]